MNAVGGGVRTARAVLSDVDVDVVRSSDTVGVQPQLEGLTGANGNVG